MLITVYQITFNTMYIPPEAATCTILYKEDIFNFMYILKVDKILYHCCDPLLAYVEPRMDYNYIAM